MQFSLDKFFEMIERRFGERPTNLLLMVIAIALFVFALNVTITYGVTPLYLLGAELLRGNEVTFALRDLLALFIALVLPSLSLFLVYQLVIKRMLRSVGEQVAKTRTVIDEVIDAAKEYSTQLHGEILAIQEADGKKLEALSQAQEGMKKLFDESQADVQKLFQELQEMHSHSHEAIENSNIVMKAALAEDKKAVVEGMEQFTRQLTEFVADRVDALEARVSKLEQAQAPNLPAVPPAPEQMGLFGQPGDISGRAP